VCNRAHITEAALEPLLTLHSHHDAAGRETVMQQNASAFVQEGNMIKENVKQQLGEWVTEEGSVRKFWNCM
jgi:hypothetical protein